MAWFNLGKKSKLLKVKSALSIEQERVRSHPLLQTRFQWAAALFGQYRTEIEAALLPSQGGLFLGLQLFFLGAEGKESRACFLGPGMTTAGNAIEKLLKNSLDGDQKEYSYFFRDLWWLLCLGTLYIKAQLKSHLVADGQPSGQKLAEELTFSFLLRSRLLETILTSVGSYLEWEEVRAQRMRNVLGLATYLFWLVAETDRKAMERLLRIIKPFLLPLFISVEDEIEKSVGQQPGLMAAFSLLQKSIEDGDGEGVSLALEEALSQMQITPADWKKEILWMHGWMESVVQQWSLLSDPSHTHTLNVMQTA